MMELALDVKEADNGKWFKQHAKEGAVLKWHPIVESKLNSGTKVVLEVKFA